MFYINKWVNIEDLLIQPVYLQENCLTSSDQQHVFRLCVEKSQHKRLCVRLYSMAAMRSHIALLKNYFKILNISFFIVLKKVQGLKNLKVQTCESGSPARDHASLHLKAVIFLWQTSWSNIPVYINIFLQFHHGDVIDVIYRVKVRVYKQRVDL